MQPYFSEGKSSLNIKYIRIPVDKNWTGKRWQLRNVKRWKWYWEPHTVYIAVRILLLLERNECSLSPSLVHYSYSALPSKDVMLTQMSVFSRSSKIPSWYKQLEHHGTFRNCRDHKELSFPVRKYSFILSTNRLKFGLRNYGKH